MEKTKQGKQINSCQTNELGYLQWHYDAARRHKAGQRQVWCMTCERYQWPDQLCEISVVGKVKRCKS